MSSEFESNESVFNTVQKFEESKIIIKAPPLGPPPPVPEKPKKNKDEAQDENETDTENQNLTVNKNNNDDGPSTILHKSVQLAKATADADSDSTLQVQPDTSSSKKTSKWKKSKDLKDRKKMDDISYSDPAIANLSQVPTKSSLKKTRSLPKLEPPKQKSKGIWFNMSEQYPVGNFSGRQTLLEQISTVIFGQKSRDIRPISRAIVLAGKSGMGKTEIARKFAFQFYTTYTGDAHVIWIDATSRETILNTLIYLLEKEILLNQGVSDDELQSIVYVNESKSRRRKKKGSSNELNEDEINARLEAVLTNKIFLEYPTIFIFDNAINEEQIVEFIPKLPPFGHIPSILVTSRNEHWNNSRVLKVAEFEFKEAVDFLVSNLENTVPEFTRFQGEDLAKELHRFPPLLQRAKVIVSSYLNTGNPERALLRLEKNVGLVRRLKSEEVIKTTELEIALLSVDRGHFYEEDAYIREFDGELRSHPISMQLQQLETILLHTTQRDEISILTINEDAYVLAVLANLIGTRSKVLGVYDSETSSEFTLDHLINCLSADNEDLLKNDRIHVQLVEVPKAKSATPNPKQSKIVPILDKLRAADTKNQLYDVILTNIYSGQDLKSVKPLLKKGGRFITSMSSSDTGVILKKVDPKKLEVKILKQDFPELLVVVRKI